LVKSRQIQIIFCSKINEPALLEQVHVHAGVHYHEEVREGLRRLPLRSRVEPGEDLLPDSFWFNGIADNFLELRNKLMIVQLGSFLSKHSFKVGESKLEVL